MDKMLRHEIINDLVGNENIGLNWVWLQEFIPSEWLKVASLNSFLGLINMEIYITQMSTREL